MKKFIILALTGTVLIQTACDLLLGPIGALSQIHKSLTTPWNLKHDLFSTFNNGWADDSRIHFVERNGTVYLIYGVQYSAHTRQDILVVTDPANLSQMNRFEYNMWSPYIRNVFDISEKNNSLTLIYRNSNANYINTYDLAGGTYNVSMNSNYWYEYLFLPDAAGLPVGIIDNKLYNLSLSGDSLIYLFTLNGLTNYIPVKSYYVGSTWYLAYINKDVNWSNRVYIMNADNGSAIVDGFQHTEDMGMNAEPQHFDVVQEAGGPLYYLGDNGLFRVDAGLGLERLNLSGDNFIGTLDIVSGVMNNGLIHLVFSDGMDIRYKIIDPAAQQVIISEYLTNFQITDSLIDLDIFVDGLSRVYIAALEYRSLEDRTFGHLIYR